jgi:hypothetical protein
MGAGMGQSYFANTAERRAYDARIQREAAAAEDREAIRIAAERERLAAKIVMAVVDRIITKVVRPGPVPEERECYDMAGELRAETGDLEALVKAIIDVNKGVS